MKLLRNEVINDTTLQIFQKPNGELEGTCRTGLVIHSRRHPTSVEQLYALLLGDIASGRATE